MPGAPDLSSEFKRARADGIEAACLEAERQAKLPQGLLLAVASRETGCRNIAGDGGHGRGVFQIDDRSHASWLVQNGAGGAEQVPPVREAAAYAARILVDNLEYGRQNGVKAADLLKFACSAYNAGTGGALAGYKQGDSDRRTAPGDYGVDVLRRLEAVRAWLARGVPEQPPVVVQPLLQPGARGPAVAELKRRLGLWYASRPPKPRYSPGPVYGPAAVEAVRQFQRANDLEPDGEVGPLTWTALASATAVVFADRSYPSPPTVRSGA